MLYAIATVSGLFVVYWQIRHLRAANFHDAYNSITLKLMSKKARIGRIISQHFNKKNKDNSEFPSFDNYGFWKELLNELNTNYPQLEQFQKLTDKPDNIIAHELREFMRNAYDAFDLVAALAWHSRIPDLWYALTTEWEDGIINTWEAGAPFLKERMKRNRNELYECFSVLYISA